MTGAVEIFKCLGDKTRYDILCRLMRSDSYVELLAEELDLTPGTISFHLKKMEKVGIVKCSREQFYMIYSVNRELLSRSIDSFITPPEESKDEKYVAKVLSSFFSGTRLVSIPVQQKKKRIVLEIIASRFSPDRTYSEKEVNEILFAVYDDFATLRRELVSFGFMERDNNRYNRK